LLEGHLKSKVITIKCPKCGRVEKYTISEEDLKEIRQIGIARVGFIHGDHSLIINFDPSGFIRGAYVVPSEEIPSDVRSYFRDYRVITIPKVKSNVEFIFIDEKQKIIDARLANISGKDIIKIMNYLDAYGTAVKGIARRIGISGRSYHIIARDGLIVIFSRISPKQIDSCFECLKDYKQDPYSLHIALNYASKKTPEELRSEDIQKRVRFLIRADSVQIRAKKGTNAIRFAKASIIALWPNLADVFDAIIRDPQIMSERGITLANLIRRNPEMDIDGLFDMLRELKKRDLIEIVEF